MGKLFKYRARNKYTDAIFTTGCLHYSHPTEFNDPYDSLLLMDISTPHYYTGQDSGGNKYLTRFGGRLISSAYQTVFDNIEIGCFSTDGCQMQMWSHYANYHKGICLEFDEDLLMDNYMRSFAVDYKQEQQKYAAFYPDEVSEEHLKVYYTKHQSWAYEKEVRIIHRTIEGSNGNYPFNKKALTGIYFGSKCPNRTVFHYMRLCFENGFKHIKFYMMELANQGHYELRPHLLEIKK